MHASFPSGMLAFLRGLFLCLCLSGGMPRPFVRAFALLCVRERVSASFSLFVC